MFFDLILSTLAIAAGIASLANAAPSSSTAGCVPPSYRPPKNCPPISGTFTVENFRYYPENVDWDTKRCLLYGSANPNATLMIYNPYTKEQNIIQFPGISDAKVPFHTSGIDYDERTDSLYITAGNAETWNTFGQNVTGHDKLIKFNPESRKVEWVADFGDFQDKISAQRGYNIGGFQDQAEDAQGNSYSAAAFGNIIAKVDKKGNVEPFYVTPEDQTNVTSIGMTGVVTVNQGRKLIFSDGVSKRFVYFDVSGTKYQKPEPTEIKISNQPKDAAIFCDGLAAPRKYNDRILMCSNILYSGNLQDGYTVIYGSKDGWNSGKYLGAIRNNDVDPRGARGTPSATVQIGDSIYVSELWLEDRDPTAPTGYGNRTTFPMIDITSRVDEIVKGYL